MPLTWLAIDNQNNSIWYKALMDQATLKPDVVIIELEHPFNINKYVKPACLPEADIAPNT